MHLLILGLGVLQEILSLSDYKCTHLPVLLRQHALVWRFTLGHVLVFMGEGLRLSVQSVDG